MPSNKNKKDDYGNHNKDHFYFDDTSFVRIATIDQPTKRSCRNTALLILLIIFFCTLLIATVSCNTTIGVL